MDKSPNAFRTISEVADELDLPQHVLRFWETRFNQIRPLKRGGGRRYYRPDDVDLLKGIRHLLYGQGYTIKGVQRILKTEGMRFVQAIGRGERMAVAPADDETDAQPAAAPAESGEGAEDVVLIPGLMPEQIAALRGALDELREADRVIASLKAAETSGE